MLSRSSSPPIWLMGVLIVYCLFSVRSVSTILVLKFGMKFWVEEKPGKCVVNNKRGFLRHSPNGESSRHFLRLCEEICAGRWAAWKCALAAALLQHAFASSLGNIHLHQFHLQQLVSLKCLSSNSNLFVIGYFTYGQIRMPLHLALY